MKVSLASLLALLALLFVHSCKELPTQTEKPITLSLALVDSTCTDLEMKLSAQPASGQRIVVERHAQPSPVIVFDAVLNKPDTSILDTGLLPNTSYTYRAYHLANNVKRDSTPALLARTMDTTSHEWTWTMQNFGDFGSSAFYDVALINDTLAYAVGEIYLNDSLGQRDPTLYNLAVWNGQRWRFERRKFTWRLLYPNSTGDPQGISPCNSIFAFNANDIWISAQTVQNWDGTTWTEHAAIVGYDNQGFPIAAGGALKIWGSSSNNIYFVGRSGLIIHYNSSSWRKIESGTSLDVVDIWGSVDEILAVASQLGRNLNRAVLRFTPTGATSLSDLPLTKPLSTIWFHSLRRYYVAGSGIYDKRHLSDSLWLRSASQVNVYYTNRIRGQAINDVITAGSFREILHYNGATWHSYRTQIPNVSGPLGGIAMKGNLAIIVGFSNGLATVVIGRRNN
jgi:hypothetical protein